MPRPDKLALIAGWLKVPPALLAWGEQGAAAEINEGALEQCIEAVRQAEDRLGVTLPGEKKARLIAVLYREATTASPVPEGQSVELMVKALA